MQKLRYEIVTNALRLHEITPAWEDLVERSTTAGPTLRPLWQRAWWDTFGHLDGRRLQLVLLWNGERLVGLASFVWRRHWYRPGIPLRRLELLASGEPQEHAICSEYNGILAERGAEQSVAETLANALDAASDTGELEPWDELVLPSVAGESPFIAPLVDALNRQEHPVTVEPEGACAFIPLPASWEDYLSSLGASTRYTFTRSSRELAQWSRGDFVYQRASTPDEVVRGRSILQSLHQQRWSAAGHDGAFASDLFRSFHNRVMDELFEKGCLELSWIMARGEPVAALYNFTLEGKVYHYQAGRKLDLPKKLHAGILIHCMAIRQAIQDGRSEYDFLAGSSRYKDELASSKRPLIRLVATRRPVVDLARRIAGHGVDKARAIQQRAREIYSQALEELRTSSSV